MQIVRDEGADRLAGHERELVRQAADALLFCAREHWDEDARAALTGVGELAGDLVATGRWGPDRAEQLLRDIECCGPMATVG